MKKYDYFTQAMKAKAHYAREWVLRAFSVVLDEPKAITPPWSLKHTDSAVLVYVPADGGWTWEVLEGAEPYQIPFIYHDSAGPAKAGDVENLKKDLPDVTWGQLLFNSRVMVYACGDILDYVEGDMIDIGKIESIFAKTMQSDPAEGEDVPGTLYVKHYMRFGKAIADMAGYELFVPSVTEHALQPPPNRDEIRSKLLEEHAHELDDPVVQVKIQGELIKAYKEHLKGDPAEGFIYSNKSIGTALKRMFLIHGPEAGFSEGGRAELVINSLIEGIDISQYPAMVNSLRAGSFYRGALTALAGEDVALMSRAFQNAKIIPAFCGTEETYDDVISDRHIGRTIKTSKGMIKLTAETINEHLGQKRSLYSPMYCKIGNKTGKSDVCSVCIGDKLAAYPESLGSMISDVPSKMMQLMMASAHAKELKTTPLDMNNFLR